MKQIRNILCTLLLACLIVPAMAQQSRTIKGTVLDENSEAIIGATVSVPELSIGTVTDLDGKFTLNNFPANQNTLQIAYLGYQTQTIDVTGKAEISVKMKPSNTELDEVVVVGYGTQKKAHLTGAIATLSPSEITDLSVTDLSTALDGMMPGIAVDQTGNRPGEMSKIVIRNSRADIVAPGGDDEGLVPLFVIDDFIYPPETGQQAFNNLEPNMIESISVLKDAAAAVYGSRSAMGVILVKTKRGQVGATKISYNGQFGYTDEFYRSKVMDSYGYGRIWNAVSAADPTQSNFDNRRDLFQADELEAMRNMNTDLLDKYWSSALTQKHSVNMSGGNENATYFAGISYVTQDGNMGRIDYERWNYRAGVDAKISKWLKASLQVSGDYGETRKSNNRVGGTNSEKDYVLLMTRPGYLPEYITDPSGRQLPVAPYGVSNTRIEQTQDYHYNEIQTLDNSVQNMPQNMVINGSLEYNFDWSEILKGLKLRGSYSKNIATTKDNEFGSSYDLYRFPDGARGGSGNHLYTDTEGYPMNFDQLTTVSVDNGQYIRRWMSRSDQYQLNFVVSYARTFGLHDVSGLFTIEKSESESEFVWGNVTLPYSFTNQQANTAGGDQTTDFNRSVAGNLSYVGRLNYSYADKYLAEFLIRSDATTRFAPENYWGVFPSLSLGWIISEESWFNKNVFDFFKIRGSFGLLGRDNVKYWDWLMKYNSEAIKGPIFGGSPDQNAGPHFQVPTDIPNRNSHWDKSYKTNFGLDMNALDSRLSLTLDAYYNLNREVFQRITDIPDYPTTVGARASKSNFGSTDDYGVELSLGWRDKIGKDLKYHVKLNTSWNDNKVIKFPWTAVATRNLDEYLPNERSDRGEWGYECIGMFRTYQEIAEYFAENNLVTYMEKTQADVHPGMLIYKDVRGSQKEDGTYYAPGDPNDPQRNKVDERDRIRISDRSGNIYGFTLNFGGEWKSFSLSAQLGASWGSYTMMPGEAINTKSIVSSNSDYKTLEYYNMPSFWADNMFVYEDVLDAQGRVVAEQNRDAKYPNLRFAGVNSAASTFWKVNNANILLRNVTLAYALPKMWVNKIGIESCRINITGQNLVDFYNPYPDKFMSVNSAFSKYPTLRKFTMGLNVSF